MMMLRGFLVNASNPKAVVFMLAVLPQFLDPSAPLLPQYLIIAATMCAVDVIVMTWIHRPGRPGAHLDALPPNSSEPPIECSPACSSEPPASSRASGVQRLDRSHGSRDHRPAIKLTTDATITEPNRYDSNAWPSAIARMSDDFKLVSEIAKLIPTVYAT